MKLSIAVLQMVALVQVASGARKVKRQHARLAEAKSSIANDDQAKVNTTSSGFNLFQSGAVCRNRGGIGGSTRFSMNVGPNNVAACAAFVSRTQDCSLFFDYGTRDGWCDCVTVKTGPCAVVDDINSPDYSVYALENDDQAEVNTASSGFNLLQSGAVCLNRGGIGGSTPFSMNVGPNNLAACAAFVSRTQGCSLFFDYGARDGWCDCVTAETGRCAVVEDINSPDYSVYALEACPDSRANSQDGKRFCCPASCGTCGGKGCSQRPGGAKSCCMGSLAILNRPCTSSQDEKCVDVGASNSSATTVLEEEEATEKDDEEHFVLSDAARATPWRGWAWTRSQHAEQRFLGVFALLCATCHVPFR